MKILGYDYTIYTNGDVEHIGAAGRFHPRVQKIQIASDQNQQQRESTVLHEVIEALSYHLQLDLEHRAIMGLEAGLYQAMRDSGVDLSPLTRELQGPEQ